MQGFQLFPVMEQSFAQGYQLRVHTPLSFKLLKELKAGCVQYFPIAPFTKMFPKNMSLEALPPGY